MHVSCVSFLVRTSSGSLRLYGIYRLCFVEKFKAVTILFSDIVTFTNIAAACTPMDIVKMLNDLYRRFDAKTSDHNVYKVCIDVLVPKQVNTMFSGYV